MRQPREQGLAELIGSLADGLGKLVTEHIALARLELTQDARALGGQVARLLAFVPFIGVGYLFLCAAAASALSRWIGWSGSLLLVGGVNVLAGGLGALRAVNRIKGRQVMSTTVEAFKESAQVLGRAAEPKAPVTEVAAVEPAVPTAPVQVPPRALEASGGR